MLELQIRFLGLKNIAALRPEAVAFYREAASFMIASIRRRMHAAELPAGGAVAPLRPRSRRIKQFLGKSSTRDWDVTGQMQTAMQAKFTKRGGLRIGFAGTRREGKTGFSSDGRRKTNQRTANLAALVSQGGRKMNESFSGRPAHAFMEPSREDWKGLGRLMEKNLWTALQKLSKGEIK